jgi:hypothetical protein
MTGSKVPASVPERVAKDRAVAAEKGRIVCGKRAPRTRLENESVFIRRKAQVAYSLRIISSGNRLRAAPLNPVEMRGAPLLPISLAGRPERLSSEQIWLSSRTCGPSPTKSDSGRYVQSKQVRE